MNRVRTSPVAALSDVRCRFGVPEAFPHHPELPLAPMTIALARRYRPKQFSDLPVVVETVDSENKINEVLPKIEGMFQGGLITLEKARVIKFSKGE